MTSLIRKQTSKTWQAKHNVKVLFVKAKDVLFVTLIIRAR